MKYKNRHEEIVKICKTAITFTEVEIKLGGSTPNTTLRRYIKQNDIAMPMFKGHKANIKHLHEHCKKKQFTIADLAINSSASRGSIKRLLFREGLKEKKCEMCGWCEKRKSDGVIPVHLHHINGDSSDNRLENLQILCPNCHALTDNYCGKNLISDAKRKELILKKAYYSNPKYICQICGKLGYGLKYCSSECSHVAQRNVVWPTKEQLEEEIENLTWVAIGNKYGVSDNAIKKWAKHYGILDKKK